MDILRKKLCALKFRKMHTKSEKISFFLFWPSFINQDGKKCSNYFKSSVL